METESEEGHARHYGSEVGEDYGEDSENILDGSLMYQSFSKAAKQEFDKMSQYKQEDLIERVNNAIYGNRDYHNLEDNIEDIIRSSDGLIILLNEMKEFVRSMSDNQNETIGVKTSTTLKKGSQSENEKGRKNLVG